MSTTAEAARKSWFRRLSLAQVAALVGVVSTIVTLLFVFKPGWKPTAPADTGTMKVTSFRVRKPVTFGRYYRLLGLSTGTLTKTYLARQGVLVIFGFELTGFRGKTLPIRWELVDASTNDAVQSDRAVGIEPSTNNDARTWYVWAPWPRTKRSYYVTVTVLQPRKGKVDVPLTEFDTKTFRGRLAPPRS